MKDKKRNIARYLIDFHCVILPFFISLYSFNKLGYIFDGFSFEWLISAILFVYCITIFTCYMVVTSTKEKENEEE